MDAAMITTALVSIQVTQQVEAQRAAFCESLVQSEATATTEAEVKRQRIAAFHATPRFDDHYCNSTEKSYSLLEVSKVAGSMTKHRLHPTA
jgi:hypothetical protein